MAYIYLNHDPGFGPRSDIAILVLRDDLQVMAEDAKVEALGRPGVPSSKRRKAQPRFAR